jgi:hypothetical protein
MQPFTHVNHCFTMLTPTPSTDKVPVTPQSNEPEEGVSPARPSGSSIVLDSVRRKLSQASKRRSVPQKMRVRDKARWTSENLIGRELNSPSNRREQQQSLSSYHSIRLEHTCMRLAVREVCDKAE